MGIVLNYGGMGGFPVWRVGARGFDPSFCSMVFGVHHSLRSSIMSSILQKVRATLLAEGCRLSSVGRMARADDIANMLEGVMKHLHRMDYA